MHQELLKLTIKKVSQLYTTACPGIYFIAPPFYAYCKKFLSKRLIFCVDCYDRIQPVASVQMQITKSQKMTVLAASAYEEPLKTLLLAKSWGDITACNAIGPPYLADDLF